MNKADIIKRVQQLGFDSGEYWLIAGAAMVMYGFRQESNDIDMGCSKSLADSLEKQGFPTTYREDGTRKITIGDDVEIFEEWLYDTVEQLDALPLISVKGLLEMKRFLGREKDLRDIKLIEEALAR